MREQAGLEAKGAALGAWIRTCVGCEGLESA
jgi:hypothetical protein